MSVEISAGCYTDKIVKRIKCGKARKKEIKKELMADINCRIEQGEKLEDIISQMGDAKELAENFNSELSDKDKKAYARNRILKIVGIVILILVALAGIFYYVMPKSITIEESRYFDKEQVEAQIRRTIEQLDNEEYDALQENAIEQMKTFLTKAEMDRVRAQICDNWGEREEFGEIYIAELVQGNKHYAVSDAIVCYENIRVIYRLTYDTDMKLAGIYVR